MSREDRSRHYVRDAAQADLETVLAMKARAWREAYGSLRDEAFFAAAEATLPQQVQHWRSQLERGTVLWLAEDAHGRCVGMASAGPARQAPAGAVPAGQPPAGQPPAALPSTALPSTELHALYVLAEAQGSGVADALLARAIGESPCRVRVPAANGRARAFLRRHGFTDVGAPVPMTGPWTGLEEQLMVRRGA